MNQPTELYYNQIKESGTVKQFVSQIYEAVLTKFDANIDDIYEAIITGLEKGFLDSYRTYPNTFKYWKWVSEQIDYKTIAKKLLEEL